MKRFSGFLWALLGLGLVVAAIAVVGGLFVLAVRAGSTVGATLVASVATVAGALIVRNVERRKVADAVRREHLADIYTELAQVLHGHESTEEERQELIANFMRKTLLYASAGTFKAHRTWRANLPPEDEDWTGEQFRENSNRYENLVKAMRKDLGISNWGLGAGDLARMGILDYDANPESETGEE